MDYSARYIEADDIQHTAINSLNFRVQSFGLQNGSSSLGTRVVRRSHLRALNITESINNMRRVCREMYFYETLEDTELPAPMFMHVSLG